MMEILQSQAVSLSAVRRIVHTTEESYNAWSTIPGPFPGLYDKSETLQIKKTRHPPGLCFSSACPALTDHHNNRNYLPNLLIPLLAQLTPNLKPH
jgi:hypothetical protein